MLSPKFPNLDAIRAPTVPSDAASLRQGEKEEDSFVQDRKRREHKREQQAKATIHLVIQANIIAAGAIILICLVIRGLHLILSEEWMWLNTTQIERLDNLFKYAGSGAVGSLLTRYLNKNVENGGGGA